MSVHAKSDPQIPQIMRAWTQNEVSQMPITIGGRGYESITCCLVRNNRLTAKPAVQLALNHRSPYSTAQGQSGTH